MANNEFDLLTSQGMLGFYQSCEVTQLCLFNKSDKSVTNLYILVRFEEKPFVDMAQKYLGPRIKVTKELSVGILRYSLSMEEARKRFNELRTGKVWEHDGDTTLCFGDIAFLPKQFVPGEDRQRLNLVLKNNFISGSYVLEFFDQKKANHHTLLSYDALERLNQLNEKIKEVVNIDLSVVRDRIGNVVFQFPVDIFALSSTALPGWDGTSIQFEWHHLLSETPKCWIQAESMLDGNYMGNKVVDYNGGSSQDVVIGNLDEKGTVKIYRQDNGLLVGSFSTNYLRTISYQIQMPDRQKRRFKTGDDKIQEISVSQSITTTVGQEQITKQVVSPLYLNRIKSRLYDMEAERLEATLSFKQYFNGDRDLALANIRFLIESKGEFGVYLWDPYLRSKDILDTLLFNKRHDAPLKAIGSISAAVKAVYEEKGKSVGQIISEQKMILKEGILSGVGLNLEFRIQHGEYGWSFHDRFLIFPEGRDHKASAYSLGTSVNSLGASHHIIQEVSHPQRVIDAFEGLWRKIDDPNCVVWS